MGRTARQKARDEHIKARIILDIRVNTDYYVTNYPDMFVCNKDGTYSFRKN